MYSYFIKYKKLLNHRKILGSNGLMSTGVLNPNGSFGSKIH